VKCCDYKTVGYDTYKLVSHSLARTGAYHCKDGCIYYRYAAEQGRRTTCSRTDAFTTAKKYDEVPKDAELGIVISSGGSSGKAEGW
jgi:hypothetical protein